MKAFDAYGAAAVAARAGEIAAAGYGAVGLYYFRRSGFKQLLTREVARAVTDAGLSLFSVYENGAPTSAGYFTVDRGNADAHAAEIRAADAGQPGDSAIYFAVDYDAAPGDLPAIAAYFREVGRVLRVLESLYRVSVYGSGLVCAHLLGAGLVTHTWLSQSTGFRGYAAFAPRANIVQGKVAHLFGLDVDMDTVRESAGAWRLAEE